MNHLDSQKSSSELTPIAVKFHRMNLFRKSKTTSIDFIKIDAEGFEA